MTARPVPATATAQGETAQREFTATLAADLAGLTAAALPAAVLERARQGVLDWLAVTLAGSRQPGALIAQELAVANQARPAATLAGTSVRSVPADAALANGLAAHALDFDDSNVWAQAHTSASVLAAALALAEDLGAPGAELVAAYVTGVQAASVVGLATGPGADARGFHLTGLTGTFGAAAACGKLLGLDAAGLARALSLAATQSAGLKAVFGTMGKHLNAARAAVDGLLAAQLVSRGFTAPAEAVTAETGYAVAYTGTFDPVRALDQMRGRYGVENLVFKQHACCHGAHSAINGIASLRARRPFRPDDVERIVLTIPPVLRQICLVDLPRTGLEGKFSLRYVAALAVAGRDTGPAAFTDTRISDPELAAVMDRVELVDGPAARPASAPTEVHVELGSGEQLTACLRAVDPAADDELPAQRRWLTDKFTMLAVPVLGEERSAELAYAAGRVDELRSTAGLMALTRPAGQDRP
jgi:2-methylcitrate dehydratase PrpD